MLRDDGGYEYKKAIVDTIMQIVDENSEAKVNEQPKEKTRNALVCRIPD